MTYKFTLPIIIGLPPLIAAAIDGATDMDAYIYLIKALPAFAALVALTVYFMKHLERKEDREQKVIESIVKDQKDTISSITDRHYTTVSNIAKEQKEATKDNTRSIDALSEKITMLTSEMEKHNTQHAKEQN